MPTSEATWPSSLKKPEINGASMQTSDTHTLIETSDGPNIRQTAWNLAPQVYQCELLCKTTAQWLTFESFYIMNLRYGNAWFTIPLAIGGAARNCLVCFNGGYTVSQISQPIRYPSTSVGYRINFSLLVFQPEYDQPPWTT